MKSDSSVYATAIGTDPPGSGRERVLFVLKTEGAQTAGRIAIRLGITNMAVRQHLAVLLEEGLVEFSDDRHKGQHPLHAGRPARLWRLTPSAYDRFADRHAELAIGMIQAIQNTFGEEGLNRLAEERTRQQIASYTARMPHTQWPLKDRVAALARIRCEEGYMAEVECRQNGTFRLVENHCSISKAAYLCQNLCGGELSLFRAVLGQNAEIERTEYILAGDRCCSYLIKGSDRNGG